MKKQIELLEKAGDAFTIDTILDIYKELILTSNKRTLEADLIFFAGVLKTASKKRYGGLAEELLSTYGQEQGILSD